MPWKPESFESRRRRLQGRGRTRAEYLRRRADPERQKVDRLRNTRAWQNASRDWLRRHPLCAPCLEAGRTRPATEVDHVAPLHLEPERLLDPANLQSICRACHNRKTAAERGTTSPAPELEPPGREDLADD